MPEVFDDLESANEVPTALMDFETVVKGLVAVGIMTVT